VQSKKNAGNSLVRGLYREWCTHTPLRGGQSRSHPEIRKISNEKRQTPYFAPIPAALQRPKHHTPFPKLPPQHPVFIRQHNLQKHQLLLLRVRINHDRRAVDCTSRDLLKMHLLLARLFLCRTGLSSTSSLSERLYGSAKTANLESAENYYASINHNTQRHLPQRRRVWTWAAGGLDDAV
jgi:hypothetical protein